MCRSMTDRAVNMLVGCSWCCALGLEGGVAGEAVSPWPRPMESSALHRQLWLRELPCCPSASPLPALRGAPAMLQETGRPVVTSQARGPAGIWPPSHGEERGEQEACAARPVPSVYRLPYRRFGSQLLTVYGHERAGRKGNGERNIPVACGGETHRNRCEKTRQCRTGSATIYKLQCINTSTMHGM